MSIISRLVNCVISMINIFITVFVIIPLIVLVKLAYLVVKWSIIGVLALMLLTFILEAIDLIFKLGMFQFEVERIPAYLLLILIALIYFEFLDAPLKHLSEKLCHWVTFLSIPSLPIKETPKKQENE